MDTETKLRIAAKALEQSIGGQAACLRAVELTLEALRGAVPDHLYSGSKDWIAASPLERIEIMKVWIESAKAESAVPAGSRLRLRERTCWIQEI
jgi:hypothetical protein